MQIGNNVSVLNKNFENNEFKCDKLKYNYLRQN